MNASPWIGLTELDISRPILPGDYVLAFMTSNSDRLGRRAFILAEDVKNTPFLFQVFGILFPRKIVAFCCLFVFFNPPFFFFLSLIVSENIFHDKHL